MKRIASFLRREAQSDYLTMLAFLVAALLVSPWANAQTTKPAPQNTLWTSIYCHSWGDSLGWTWMRCEQPPPAPVIVTKTEVREVKVPTPIVVPAPAPAPKVEKKIGE